MVPRALQRRGKERGATPTIFPSSRLSLTTRLASRKEAQLPPPKMCQEIRVDAQLRPVRRSLYKGGAIQTA